ncbi:DNA-directed DNA polymerase [Nanoarchaeota archaeon]
MPKIEFYPLDVQYKVIRDKPVVYLYGRTSNNEQICVTDSTIDPYFYVLPETTDISNLQKKLEKVGVEKKDVKYFVTRTEVADKYYLEKPVKAIRVYVNRPASIALIRREIKDWPEVGRTTEIDIKFIRRYLIDKNITPMMLCEAEGEFIKERSKVPILESNGVTQVSEETLTKPRILAFDIETYNPLGKAIDSSKNPIIMVSFYGEDFKKVITWKKFKTKLDYVEFVDGEAELINEIKEVIDDYKPDILTGYFSDGFDFPYIRKRATKYKIKLDIGLDYSELDASGRSNKAKLTGIVHLDVFKFIAKVMSNKLETNTLRLDDVAKELLGVGKVKADLDNLSDVWDNKPDELGVYCEYNLQDSAITYQLCEKVFPNILEFVKIIGLPIFDITRMGFSQLVEWYLIRQAKDFDELAPNRPHYDEIGRRKTQTYKGAFVFEPKPGLYDNIVVFDFRSLYPTEITSHNISIGMLNCNCCRDTEKVPDQDFWFCKKRKGFMAKIIENLIERRQRIKEIMSSSKKEFEEDEFKRRLLNARQESLKTLASAFYGYLGFFSARWYCIECAKAVTSYGRHYIQEVIKKAEKNKFEVLYSDTDSVFLALGKKKKEDSKKFADSINQTLPGSMELEFEGFYPAGIFVSAKMSGAGAKKKYALLSEEGYMKIKGFETVRRNWSPVAKEMQEKVLRIILKEKDVDKAVDYVKKVVKEIENKEVPLKKVIIFTQLQKPLESYESIGPHVAIAKKLQARGHEVAPGTTIEYVIGTGSGKIRDRAKLPDEIVDNDYDSEYYIKNQVLPSVDKIFEALGKDIMKETESKEQSKLGQFV